MKHQMKLRTSVAAAGISLVALVGAACVPETPPGSTVPTSSTAPTSSTTTSSTSSTSTTTTSSTTTTTLPEVTRQQAANAAAANWLSSQFAADGVMYFETAPTTRDRGNAVLAVSNLAALGVDAADQQARYDAFIAGAEAYINEGAGDRAGALARVILAVIANGGNPRSVNGSDLVARLEASQQANGLFGTQYAGFDGSFRQGLSLAALSLAAPTSPKIAPAVAWLKAQQCADGSWMMFRASTAGDCVENTAMRVFKDSNGSAFAVLGLSAVGATANVDPAGWFNARRGNDGGWGTSPAGPATESDANSTGLVIAALEALGEPIPGSAWDALLAFQLGADAPVVNRGAFQWKLLGGGTLAGPNRLATLDAQVALFDEVWPAALKPAA